MEINSNWMCSYNAFSICNLYDFVSFGIVCALVLYVLGLSANRGLLWRIIFGIGTPLLTAVFWGLFVASKSYYSVSISVRTILKFIVFALAALALYASAKQHTAIIFFVAVIM